MNHGRQFFRFCACLITSCLFVAGARAQSFDCKKASTRTELAICGEPSLGELDLSLTNALKESLIANPELRAALLSDERRWLAARDRECLGQTTSEGLSTCLASAYDARIASLKSGAVKNAASRSATASCQVLADRYRVLADTHPGESPLGVLTHSPGSGVTLADKLAQPQNEAELRDWGRRQKPPIDFPAKLNIDFYGGDMGLEKLPNADFYAISSIQGTAYCYSSSYFVVKSGQAQEIGAPPGFSDDEGAGCGVYRSFGTIDQVPVFFQEFYDGTPSMKASVQVAAWHSGRFDATCTVDFSYAPLFRDTTLNDWPTLDDTMKSCSGADCEQLQQAAYELVKAVQNNPGAAEHHFLGLLSPPQLVEYRKAEMIANGDQAAASSGGPAAKAQEQESDPADLTEQDPLLVPYIVQGRLYIVSLGHFTIGWRYFGDWSVKFAEVENGPLEQRGAFAIGMVKGRMQDISIHPVKATD